MVQKSPPETNIQKRKTKRVSEKKNEQPQSLIDNIIVDKNTEIRLQKYQIAPLQRIVARCESQKGVLVYYDTGTGKTYIGLSFLQNFPNYTAYVIVPETLEFIWKGSEGVIGNSINIKYVTHSFLENNIFTPDTSKPYVIVVDEAHNLLRVIGIGAKYSVENYDAIVGAKKILLMTATPFVDGINDISVLVNICAGRKVLEPDQDIFHKYYRRPLTEMSFLRGWAIPSMANKTLLAVIIFSAQFALIGEMMKAAGGGYGQIHFGKGEFDSVATLKGTFYTEEQLEELRSNDTRGMSGSDINERRVLLENYSERFLQKSRKLTDEEIKEFINKWHLYKKPNRDGIEAYFYPNTNIEVTIPTTKVLNLVEYDRYFFDDFTRFVMNILTFGAWNRELKKIMLISQQKEDSLDFEELRMKMISEGIEDGEVRTYDETSQPDDYFFVEPGDRLFSLFIMTVSVIVGYVIFYIVAKNLIIREEFLPELEELDARKIVDICRPYILVYQKSSKTNPNFPEQKNVIKYIDYDHHQLVTWLKITLGYVEPDFFVRNGMKEFDRYGKKMTNDQYLDKGRSIGNLFFEVSEDFFVYPTKFYMVMATIYGIAEVSKKEDSLKSMLRQKNRLIHDLYQNDFAKIFRYAKKIDEFQLIEKVSELESDIRDTLAGVAHLKFSNSVIYSNFEESGCDLFISFLNKYEIKHLYLHPKLSIEQSKAVLADFRSEPSGKLLILHPSMKEGVDIKGAMQFHILEPIMKLSDKIQIYGRVVRFQSHTHLPKSQQKVTIYEWVSTNTTWTRGTTKFLENFKAFAKHDTYLSFSYFQPKISQLESPDSIVSKRSTKFSRYITDIQEATERNNKSDSAKDFGESTCDPWIPGETSNKPCSRVLYSS